MQDTSEASPALRAEQLSVDRGAVPVLHGIDLTIRRGELVTITGSNGAGKTTLLKATLGLLPLRSGSIYVHGTLVGSPEWRRERRAVGYVSQHAVQTDFPISVREVVAIGFGGRSRLRTLFRSRFRRSRSDRGDRGDQADRGAHTGFRAHCSESIAHALERTGVAHLADFPYTRLSGGQKQRVSIARCLCQNPKTLLLDEPTASLDPDGKSELLALAERLSADLGITVIMVTHEESTFDRPHWRRIALDAGRIVSSSIVSSTIESSSEAGTMS